MNSGPGFLLICSSLGALKKTWCLVNLVQLNKLCTLIVSWVLLLANDNYLVEEAAAHTFSRPPQYC